MDRWPEISSRWSAGARSDDDRVACVVRDGELRSCGLCTKGTAVHGHVQLAVRLANRFKFKLQKHLDIFHIDVLIPNSIANTHTQDMQTEHFILRLQHIMANCQDR